ncbi:MAG: hypothetical protein JW882_09825 [Deltaproteobacteria bacterium]|nr:hypothetical protein [Deltaproteobacteria bacterium]
MFDEAKVKLIIEAATDAARKKVQEFAGQSERGFKQAEQSAKSFSQGLQDTWAKAKAAWVEITAVALALKKAYDMAYQAAQFREREQAFANMAASHGIAADKIISDLKRVSKGTIDTMTLIEKAGTAMSLGIQADKISELMAVARASAKVTGQTVTQAFSDITLAVGRQSRMILDNLGIIVKVEEANERYAQQIGKVASQLTEAERKQAFLNATLEAGGDIIDRVGKDIDSVAEKIQRYEARWKDIGLGIGKVFLTVGMAIDQIITGSATTLNWTIRSITYSTSLLLEQLSKLPIVGEKAFGSWAKWAKEADNTVNGWVRGGIKDINDTWETIFALWKKIEPTHQQLIKDLEDQGKAAKGAADEVKKLMDLQKSDAEKRQQAIEAMYNEAGINAEGFYREEVNKITKQAKAWKDAGVNIEDINEWLFARIEKIQEEAFSKGAQAQADWLGQLKWHAGEMVSDLEEKEAMMMERFAEIGQGIANLDGSQIGVHVQLYDQPFVDGVERLISSLERLRSVQAGVGSGSTESGTSGGTASATISQGGNTVNLNINEKMSRSDIANLIEEQTRTENRS